MDIVTYGALNKKVGEKLSSNQGTQNAGKMLGINNEGEIQPIQVLGGNVSVTETLESGEDYSMVIEEGEPTAVTSVAGKYGTVTLDAGDIEYDEQEVYNSGTVGKEVGDLKSQVSDLYVTETVTPNFKQGTIAPSTGGDDPSTTRVRTGFFTYTTPVSVSLGIGYKFSWRIYQNDGTYISSSDWINESVVLSFTAGQKFRFVVAYTDNRAITPADVTGFTFSTYTFTDTTLAIPGKAADAAAVGAYIDQAYTKPVISFSQGSLSLSNGGEIDSDTRLRSWFLVYSNTKIESTLYKYTYRVYALDKTYISDESSSEWHTGELKIPYMPNRLIRIIIAYINDAQITPSDVTSDLTITTLTDTTLSNYGKIADAGVTRELIRSNFGANSTSNNLRGNVTVRAAKTINFDDGTPPQIDWYLLQDVDNKFYMSKDLSAKYYLFTFVPPVNINVADWSVGICGNNDIIFVADAAGLSDSSGRLNDTNRVNPVCFSYAENYSTMHIINFGDNLKPCGWLENVGFCVLPNGNVVICEYTRGTVKTANVWLISGDVSDPSNWDVTWSVDIIDTTDTTSAGIKHCHEVQYDFYTGILYFGTGDSTSGSYNYYSTDNGATWMLLYGPNKNRCRRLNYVFTKDYVYWASDSYESEYHHFFIAQRDNDGLVDVGNATQVNLPSTNQQACYGCAYVQSLNAVVMMDRIDGSGSSVFYWYCYDIDSQTVKLIGEIHSINNAIVHLGFRTKFVDWYPIGNTILAGFNPASGSVNPDTNVNALCGNLGGTSGNGSTRINNLLLSVYRQTDGNYSFRASTIYC